MRDAKTCPVCGFLLRHEDPADASFSPVRYVAVDLLLWVAVALFLACLWAPPEVNEGFAFLAFAALCAWLWQRPRQRAEAAALLQRRRYRCAQCKRDFRAGDLD
jgi:Flp pilus assembly protein TadB